jgi:uncharacterized protein YgiM (DUF1202 family)
MYLKNKATIIVIASLLFFANRLSLAQETFPFQVEILDNNINIRSDSTVSSPVLCKVNKGERLTVLSQHYDWYKVELPKNTPSFIKEDFVSSVDSKTASVINDRVNIRFGPGESFPIIGVAGKEEALNVLEHNSGWYKIEPTGSCFGWLHKQFTKKFVNISKTAEPASGDTLTIEGTIKPYGVVFKRVAQHKIITQDEKMFLLKSDKENLNAFKYRKVKVTGKIISGFKEKYPVIEVIRLEPQD